MSTSVIYRCTIVHLISEIWFLSAISLWMRSLWCDMWWEVYFEWTIRIDWQHWTHKTQDEDNPDTLATLGTQDTGRRQSKHKDTTQKTKRRSNTDRQSGVSSCAREGYTVPASNNTSIVLLTYSRRVGHHYPLANTQIRMASSYTYLG